MIGPEKTVADHMRARRRDGFIWLVIALILAISLGTAWKSDERAEKNDAQLSSRGAEVETLRGQVHANGQIAQDAKNAAEEANRRLRAAGKPTVPVPTESPISPTVAPPPPQIDDLNGAEVTAVRAIVTDQLSRQKVTITQAEVNQIARTAAALIPKPADGKTPTEAQIRPVVVATVAAYCVGDKCVGPPGDKGEKGDKGEDAPKVTDEELLAAAKLALAAYCGLESQPCKGPQGEPGATVTGPPGADGKEGPEGTPGRGIAGVSCQEDGRWLFRYTDSSTELVEGPCRAVIAPPSAPTPAAKKSR